MISDSAPAERNKAPILDVLREVLPARGLVLEVASGTGQHVVHFAAALPQLRWQPSDADPDCCAAIETRREQCGLANVAAPVRLDVCGEPWPIERADAVLCINMIHISPWPATLALVAGAGRLLPPDAPLCLYGPFRRGGMHTAPSNAAFDTSLKSRNPDWGVRDLEAVEQVAQQAGFGNPAIWPMPANNLTVVFRRLA